MNTQLKLKFYYDHVSGTAYDEGPDVFHEGATEDIVQKFIDSCNLAKDASIIDLGCGSGHFLDAMQRRGYTNLKGIAFNATDVKICTGKGHQVERGDTNFLKEADNTYDMIFCRQTLQRSPFPYITLLEYNRVLKANGILYVEVPAPGGARAHEANKNNYSILDKKMWLSLFERTGFDGTWNDLGYNFESAVTDELTHEDYYAFVLQRKRPVDIK